MGLIDLKDMDLEDTRQWIQNSRLEAYRAQQIRQWIFARRARSFGEMTNLSKKLREHLESSAFISRLKILKSQVSTDGSKKFLFRLHDGNTVESVLIPERNHYTACISSQVGCAMGCKFCLTAKQGLTRNLKSSEIVNQVLCLMEAMGQPNRLSNIVFMGMGEPLANYEAVKKAAKNIISPDALNFARRRVTISTCGLVPEIEKMGKELPVNLAASLNAPDDKIRDMLMPVNRKYPLPKLMDALSSYPLPRGRRISFEYILIKDINDSVDHAKSLAELIKGIKAKINLIPFNGFKGSPFEQSSEHNILRFQGELIKRNYTATIRKSKGSDISAACGQLRAGL